MKLLNIKIKQKSPAATEFKGDTFFGHLFLAIKFLYGEEKINDIAERYEKEPIFIVSDLFPLNHVPKPLKFSLKEEDLKIKSLKKIKWIKQDEVVSESTIKVNFLSISQETKNNTKDIDKETNTQKTTPYTLPIYRYKNGGHFFVLINEELLKEFGIEFEKLLDFVSLNGYGKKSNLGKGIFEFDIDYNFKFKQFDNYMISSLCNEENSLFDVYDIKMKQGFKHYGGIKKQNILKLPGSVLKENRDNKQYIGKAIYNREEKYIEQGFSILIPFNL